MSKSESILLAIEELKAERAQIDDLILRLELRVQAEVQIQAKPRANDSTPAKRKWSTKARREAAKRMKQRWAAAKRAKQTTLSPS